MKYHKALGTYPGVVTFSKQIQVYESDNCKALMTEHYDTVSNYIFIIFFLIKVCTEEEKKKLEFLNSVILCDIYTYRKTVL